MTPMLQILGSTKTFVVQQQTPVVRFVYCSTYCSTMVFKVGSWDLQGSFMGFQRGPSKTGNLSPPPPPGDPGKKSCQMRVCNLICVILGVFDMNNFRNHCRSTKLLLFFCLLYKFAYIFTFRFPYVFNPLLQMCINSSWQGR